MRIYIESTIPSYLVARPARDLLQTARQQTSKDWWELRRHQHELFTSQIVLNEIASGEAEMAKQRLATLAGIPILRGNAEAENLTLDSRFRLAARCRRPRCRSYCTRNHLRNGYTLELDCRHIANASIQARLRKLAAKSGLTLPVLCKPDELTGELYEE